MGKIALREHLRDLAGEFLAHGRLSTPPRFDEPGFGGALEDHADELRPALTSRDAEGFLEFDACLKSLAMTATTTASGHDGEPLAVEGRLFVVPVTGVDRDVERACSDPDVVGALARTFRGRGLASSGSTVYLATALVPPVGVALADVDGIRALALSFLSAMTRGMCGMEAPSAEVFRVVAERFHGVPAGTSSGARAVPTLVNRAMVGMRVHVAAPGCPFPEDYLTRFVSPPAGGPIVDRPSVWLDAANRSVARHGIGLGLPRSFTACAGAMALNSVETFLAVHRAADGCTYADADEVHLCHEPDTLWVSFAYGRHVIGPLRVDMLLATWDMEGVAEAIRATLSPGGHTIHHAHRSTLPRGDGVLVPANDH